MYCFYSHLICFFGRTIKFLIRAIENIHFNVRSVMVVDVRVHVVVVHMMVMVHILWRRSTILLAHLFRINNIKNIILVQLSRWVLEVQVLVLPAVMVLVTQVRQTHLRTLIWNWFIVVDLVLVKAVISIHLWSFLVARLIMDWVPG